MRSFNMFIALALSMGLCLLGCSSSGGRHADNLRAAAKDVAELAEHIKRLESGTLEETEKIHTAATNISNIAKDVSAGLPSDSPLQPSMDSIAKESDVILQHRSTIVGNSHTILKDVKILDDIQNGIVKDSKSVQDAPSFWSGIAFWIKAMFLTTVAVLLTAVCWRFGLDKLVRAVAETIAGWIEGLGKRIHTRFDGPVKLAKEAVEGKTSWPEVMAALREASPEIDRLFKKESK